MRESVARTFKQIVCFIKGKLQGNGECYYCRLLGRVPFDEYARFSKQMGLKQERERIYIDGRWRVAPGRIDKKLNVVNTMKISVPRDAYKIKGMTSEAKRSIGHSAGTWTKKKGEHY